MQAMKSLMVKMVILGLALTVAMPVAVHAASTQSILHQACTHGANLAGCGSGDQGLDTAGPSKTTYLQDLVNVFIYAAGIVAVIFLIIGGIRYITSTGDAARIKAAKDTILYAIIGIIVTILALPISGYVVKTVGG